MLAAALVGLSLLATPPAEGIAVTRFRLVQVAPELGGYVEDRLAQHLTTRGFQVSTPADLETVLGLERQRQLLGCSDDTSCFAEISGALGVPLVATGRLTRLGKRLEIDVRVIRQKDAKVAASVTRGTDDESRLGVLIEECAESLAEQLQVKPARAPFQFRWRLWTPVALGFASLVAGGVLVGLAEVEYASYTTPREMGPAPLSVSEAGVKFSELSTRRGLGFGFAGLGAALVATGLVWNALTPEAPVAVSFGAGPGGGVVVLGGRF